MAFLNAKRMGKENFWKWRGNRFWIIVAFFVLQYNTLMSTKRRKRRATIIWTIISILGVISMVAFTMAPLFSN
jgi:CHASE2 domain-containing sensor protein